MEELRTRMLLRESRLSQLRSLRWSLEESWRQRWEYLRGGSDKVVKAWAAGSSEAESRNFLDMEVSFSGL